jgi:hypothetical protein
MGSELEVLVGLAARWLPDELMLHLVGGWS